MMGGPCMDGGGTVEEMLFEDERLGRMRAMATDRYEELVSVRKVGFYKSCYEIVEMDSDKGARITKVDAESGAIIRESK